MNRATRNPLAKERFLEGTRQKWFAVVLLYVLIVLYFNANYGVDPAPYMNFLLISVPIFIGSLTLSSYNKERAAERRVR